MKTIRRAFVLLLAVLMLIGMALPACAEELALDAEPIVEDSAPETTPDSAVTPEPEVTSEPTATPDPVPADAATPLALESEGAVITLTTHLKDNHPDMLQGDTIRLTDDLDLSSKTVIFNDPASVTLDLNGHTLTVGSLLLDNHVTVMLTDSSASGAGRINGPISMEPGSTLVPNGGTVTSTTSSTLGGTIETGTGTTVFNGPVITGGNSTISGGVFKGAVTNNGTISGGTFNGNVAGDGSISGGVFYGGVPTNKIAEDSTVYTVTFDLNGGTGSIPNQVVVGSTSATAIKPATDPTRDGYAFLAWYKDGEPYNFNSPVTRDFTLKAEWLSYGYTINYLTEGGKLPSSYPTGYATGTTVTLPTPIRTGFTFGGWYYDRQFEGLPIATIGANEYGDKTFVAKWTLETYDIKYFGIDHATLPLDEKFNHYTIESETLTLPIPSQDGFTFDGWYTNADLSGDAVTQIVTGTTGDLRFYAKWTENQPTGGSDQPTGGGSAGGNSAKAPSSASKPAIPKTGDDGMIVLWLALAAASTLALGYVTAWKRKN